MPVPFQQLAGKFREVVQAVNDGGNADWRGYAGVRHAIAHGIADTDFYGKLVFFHQLLQFRCKRDDKAVKVGAGAVLEMAAGDDTHIQRGFHDMQIVLHGFFSGLVQFIEDMVIRAACQYAAFLQSHIFHQLEVFRCGAYPACNFRECKTHFPTGLDCPAVVFAVNEKFALAYLTIRAAQTVQHFVKRGNLLDGIRRPCLLPVPKGGICYPYFIRHVHRDKAVVKCAFGYFIVCKIIPVKVWLGYVLQAVFIFSQLQQVFPLII